MLNEEGLCEECRGYGVLPTDCQFQSAINQTMVFTDELYTNFPTLSWCNKGVSKAFSLLTNENVLDNMTANQMVNYWINTDDKWILVNIENAQSLANSGEFVVAGKTNSDPNSGHVVLVIPGTEIPSGNWDGGVPMAMDTGDGKRWPNDAYPDGRAISYSWTYPTGVLFFKYIGERTLNSSNFEECNIQ